MAYGYNDKYEVYDRRAPESPSLPRGEYFPTDKVYGLTLRSFEEFVHNKEFVMVMFYDVQNPQQRATFARAADNTCRFNHAYAAVNCNFERELCEQEGAWRFPLYRLYKKNKIVTSIPSVNNPEELVAIVKNAE